jgi:GrpB-like predicted nucleotidyltransferase (UPF0157 family)
MTQAPREPNMPMTEERILAAHIGEKRPHNGAVHLAEYDPAWPGLFARHAERIGGALGDRALMIEHVGSTSVPGLAAKPTIDILLVVADSADEDAYVPALETAGYELRTREPDWGEHRGLRDRGSPSSALVHVLTLGDPEIERYLLFRHRLRTNQADRELYERTKRGLARREWKYAQNYADAKGPVVEEIIAHAR